MRDQGPCACDEFAIWYVELEGVTATKDHVVCKCGHSTREHVASVERCLGEVEVTS